ncbi:MAG: thioesterase domain-containing protein [Phycisphaerales bacterium]
MRPARWARRVALFKHTRWMFAGRMGAPADLVCTPEEAARLRRRMRRTPAPIDRPVVVISGYLDPGLYAGVVSRELRRLTSHDPADFHVARFALHGAIEPMAERVTEKLRAIGSESFDLVGLSMGGLIARRVAAVVNAAGDRRVERVFTLGTPHRGSTLAERIAPTEAARQMRPGSEFLRALDAALGPSGIELVAYQMEEDAVIGDGRGVPEGHPGIRLPRRAGEPHLHIMGDPIAILDIGRRLRGESPILNPDPS